ncbi:MAG: MMPL family transporter [Coriobacteriales bacterium]|nr:MMPL family transporter [Coriobacteriales bacterium]
MIIFAVLALVGAFLSRGVVVNNNLVDYLPASSPSTISLNTMNAEFTTGVPNLRIQLNDVTIPEALDYKAKLKALPGVSDVTWLDDNVDIKEPLATDDAKTVSDYYKVDQAASTKARTVGNAMISLSLADGDIVTTMPQVYDLIGPANYATGDAVNTYVMHGLASSQVSLAMSIAVPIIIIILVLTTMSWIEPLLYFAAIGVAILINMGSNIFFPDVSFVTSAVSPILQLAISLDYAIILLHGYQHERERDPGGGAVLWMKRTLGSSLSIIFACAATVFFGFAALCVMQFRIGADLGLNLLKGTIFSFVSVAVFLPALTVLCDKLLIKTRHRRLIPPFAKAGHYIIKGRWPVLVLVVILVVPCFLGMGATNFTYGSGGMPSGTRAASDDAAIQADFGQQNAVVLLVPKGDVARERQLGDALKALPDVTSVLSYAETVGNTVPQQYVSPDILKNFYSAHYARIILETDTPSEGAVAFATVERIRATASQYYSTVYSTGQSVNLYDIAQVIHSDHFWVDLLSMLAIALVIAAIFRSIGMPILLVFSIETAIAINMAVPYFAGTSISFIGYLIISTVQLASSADYGLLYTQHYLRRRREMPARAAAEAAHATAFQPIIVSAAILASAGFALYFTSSIDMVKEMGLLLGRGTLISLVMITCFMPGLLEILDRPIRWTSWRPRFFGTKGAGQGNIPGSSGLALSEGLAKK